MMTAVTDAARNEDPGAEPTTSELLLDAGERLIAQRGVQAVALKEVAVAAGQRNNGATQYHFGDKAGLVRAIFERRAAVVNRRRLELLDETAAEGRVDVCDLTWAYVAPLGEQVAAGNWYVMFLARMNAEHERGQLQRADPRVNTAYRRLHRHLRQGPLAALPTAVFQARWRLFVNLSIDALADYQAEMAAGERLLPIDRFVAELAAALAGLLTAPPTP
jgi:AcrR family transcriptional regulator